MTQIFFYVKSSLVNSESQNVPFTQFYRVHFSPEKVAQKTMLIFPATQILREINFRDFRDPNTAILTHLEAQNFDFM